MTPPALRRTTIKEDSMKERPILFSGAMVRALLDGRKTQTRRVVKARPGWPISFIGGAGDQDDPSCYGFEDLNTAQWWTLATDGSTDNHQIPCPYGRSGDRLWIRETFAHMYRGNVEPETRRHDDVIYGADGFAPDEYVYGSWKPSIHMPRWASRITLEITGVRVERLQSISEADAEAEGINFLRSVPDADETLDARGLFHCLWDAINGDGAWAANPWVWVVEFRRVQ
jgi:hypothetical protein